MSKSKKKDPYRFKEATQTNSEAEKRILLDEYFTKSIGSNYEKICNFPKFLPRAHLTRFLARIECFKKALEVQGIVVDCGVLFGGSLMTWARASSIFEPLNSQRKIIGFDTFEGFPDFSAEDATGAAAESKEGGFHFGGDDVYSDLLQCIKVFDSDRPIPHIPKVEIIKGDCTKTIPAYLEKNPHTIVSLLHLDVDIYEPTRAALKHFVPRMPKGAIIVFDQLNSPLWPGESIALLDELGVRDLRIQRFTWDTYLSYAVL